MQSIPLFENKNIKRSSFWVLAQCLVLLYHGFHGAYQRDVSQNNVISAETQFEHLFIKVKSMFENLQKVIGTSVLGELSETSDFFLAISLDR